MFLTEWVTLWMRYLIPGDSFESKDFDGYFDQAYLAKELLKKKKLHKNLLW